MWTGSSRAPLFRHSCRVEHKSWIPRASLTDSCLGTILSATCLYCTRKKSRDKKCRVKDLVRQRGNHIKYCLYVKNSSSNYFFPDFLIPPLTRGPLPAALAAISFSFFCSSLCLACRACNINRLKHKSTYNFINLPCHHRQALDSASWQPLAASSFHLHVPTFYQLV